MWAIYKKELRAYLLSPMAWVIWVAFTTVSGFGFFVLLYHSGEMMQQTEMGLTEYLLTPFYGFLKFLLLLICPIFTMRLFAEERQTGTLELLFTYPLTEAQLLFGKALAAMTTAVIMMGLTLPPMVYLNYYTTVDWAVVFTVYIGFLLLAATFISIGLWSSSMTNNQAVAFGISFGILIMLWLANALQSRIDLGPIGRFFKSLSLLEHYESFGKGLLNSNDILFYLSLITFFLYVTSKQLEARKWRG